MTIKENSKIVCINPGNTNLELYSIYTVDKNDRKFSHNEFVILKEKPHIKFKRDRFITITEYRKEKLKLIEEHTNKYYV